MAIKTPLRRGVSPTLHPSNITGITNYEEAKGYVSHAVTALDSAYQAIEAVADARRKLALDESRTQKARVLMAAQMADKYLGQLQKLFVSSWERLSSGISSSENELSRPLEEYAGLGNVATEIRAHLKAMPAGDRRNLLTEALAKGDEKTLKSVLGAPAYLSGISDVEKAHMTRNYHSKNNPDLASRLEVMKQARDRLERAKPVLFAEMEKAVGVKPAELEKLRTVSSDAEAALILKDFAAVED